jgi:hypothetical protein
MSSVPSEDCKLVRSKTGNRVDDRNRTFTVERHTTMRFSKLMFETCGGTALKNKKRAGGELIHLQACNYRRTDKAGSFEH